MTTIEKTDKALADVRHELQLLEAQYTAAGHELGDALARVRTGDKKAQAAAGKASMKRAELSSERDRLQLEESSLLATLDRLRTEGDSEAIAGLVHHFEAMTEQARELEEQLASQMLAAAETASQLRQTRPEWTEARNALGKLGRVDVIEGVEEPRNPSALFTNRMIGDARSAVDAWLKPAWRWTPGMYDTRRTTGTHPEPKPFRIVDEDRTLGTILQAMPERDGAA